MENLKPLHIYLGCIVCFIASNIFSRAGIAILDYIFAAIGFVFLFFAIKMYFKKPR